MQKAARELIIHVWMDYLFIYCDPTYLGLMENDPALSKRYRFIKRYAVGGEKAYPEKAGLSNHYKHDMFYSKGLIKLRTPLSHRIQDFRFSATNSFICCNVKLLRFFAAVTPPFCAANTP